MLIASNLVLREQPRPTLLHDACFRTPCVRELAAEEALRSRYLESFQLWLKA